MGRLGAPPRVSAETKRKRRAGLGREEEERKGKKGRTEQARASQGGVRGGASRWAGACGRGRAGRMRAKPAGSIAGGRACCPFVSAVVNTSLSPAACAQRRSLSAASNKRGWLDLGHQKKTTWRFLSSFTSGSPCTGVELGPQGGAGGTGRHGGRVGCQGHSASLAAAVLTV